MHTDRKFMSMYLWGIKRWRKIVGDYTYDATDVIKELFDNYDKLSSAIKAGIPTQTDMYIEWGRIEKVKR